MQTGRFSLPNKNQESNIFFIQSITIFAAFYQN
jgi:hypothetical protein